MRYGSVCSGIEAATMAWHTLGWSPAFFSEIEKFPSQVLAHHYGSNMPGDEPSMNGVPNYGDMTKFEEWPDHAIDLLVGGTPCQSFSVAGLRQGLADPRGNLMLTYLAIARRYQPRWLVWENVPGVLSSNGGRDFGTFIRGLEECGYHAAWRVLDAQFVRVDGYERAVPQRRRRVFIVGYLGDWRRAAAVLFEPESLRGDPAPRRQAGEGTAGTVARSVAIRGRDGTPQAELGDDVANAVLTPNGGRAGVGVGAVLTHVDDAARCVTAGYAQRIDAETENFVAHVAPTVRSGGNQTGGDRPYGTDVDTCESLIAFNSREDPEVTWNRTGPLGSSSPQSQAIAYGLRNDAGREGTAKTPSADASGNVRLRDPGFNIYEGFAPTLDAGGPHAVAWSIMPQNSGKDYKARAVDVAQPVMAGGPVGGNQGGDYIQQQWAVRRLTPTECERLQGFPDHFTDIRPNGKPTADGPRYKALGNSFAVNVVRWLGLRIQHVESIIQEENRADVA